MKSRIITIIILISVVAGLIAWDIVVAANDTPGDTISEIVLKAARAVPALAFAIGVVCGHLFWPQRQKT